MSHTSPPLHCGLKEEPSNNGKIESGAKSAEEKRRKRTRDANLPSASERMKSSSMPSDTGTLFIWGAAPSLRPPLVVQQRLQKPRNG
mmetsp:Transcript_12893/g.23346  ORF Transcript_12893/g.23346 Transcript_12893/m.23346 type:complete len:87 (-) Transcript_12893:1378-1638(-)